MKPENTSGTSQKLDTKDLQFYSFKKFLGRDVGILRMMGLYSMNSVFTDNLKKPTVWETVTVMIGLANLSILILSEINFIVDVWSKDPQKAIVLLAAVLSGILCLVKALRLWMCRDELRKLLHRLAIMWNNSNHRITVMEENIKIAARTYYLGKIFIIIVLCSCSIYAVKPHLHLLHYHLYEKFQNVSYDYTTTIFAGRYLWSTESTSKYLMCISWEQFVMFFIALFPLSSDIMFAQLTTHMAIQFRVLCHDLKYLMAAPGYNSPKNERELINGLYTIAERHRDLYTYCKTIERIFNPIFFITLTLTAANMCLCSFQLRKELSHGNWVDVMKSLFHAVVITTEGFIYCGFADALTGQSNMMTQAAYECQWTERSKEFKIMLHIIMIRSQRPFIFTAYGFFGMHLNQMTAIFKAAGSYFTLLKSVT